MLQQELIEREKLNALKKKNMQSFYEIKINKNELTTYEDNGWEIIKEFKSSINVRKDKKPGVFYFNKIWNIFFDLGFEFLSDETGFDIKDDNSNIVHYDIVVADNDTALFIKYISEEELVIGKSYKEYIDEFQEERSNTLNVLKRNSDNRKIKMQFVLITKNIVLSNSDMTRLEDLSFIYFDEDVCDYYDKLTKNLGCSAKYQLLGYLFDGNKIPNLENRIPAIQGKLGKHTFYSFSIEPEKLLKISFVLHRNKANKKAMPTYQRLIKRNRINGIRNFINEGGYFPNSVIVNINTNGHGLTFDSSSLQEEHSVSKIGILHLPQKYRAAYIIDGQHRLYGYAASKYKTMNTIPVVAFLDLDRTEQVKLFMEINENQKAVSKNLRNTLNSDLLWDSDLKKEQRDAIRSTVAQNLGDDHDSPLYDRIIVGENEKTKLRCVTLDTVVNALKACSFLSSYNKNNKLEIQGTLDFEDIEVTVSKLTSYLMKCFMYVKLNCSEEWRKGECENGFLTINNGIHALIKIFDDILNILMNKIEVEINDIDLLFMEVKEYLDPLIIYINSISEQEKEELRRSYGSGGKTKVWRSFEIVIQKEKNDFTPSGLEKHIEDNAKTYNEESFKMIRDIECAIKDDIKNKLNNKYGDTWFTNIPEKVYSEAKALASKKEYANPGEKHDPWDCLNFIHYREIVTQSGDWSELFESSYSYLDDNKKNGNKKDKTNWMDKISKIRNNNVHSYSVKKDEFVYLKKIHDWLCANENDSQKTIIHS